MRRTRRRDGGVTVVEAAFALPILFLFIFGLVDLGMWTFNSNQASNAARDGARVAILAHEFADDAGSDPKVVKDRDAIVAAVRAHLPNQTVADTDIAISCVEPDGTPVDLGCSEARVDVDRIRVDVQWSWKLVTPVAAVIGVEQGVARGSATMAIVGRPVAGAPVTNADSSTSSAAGDCAVPALNVSPQPVQSKGNQLQEHLVIDFTTDGAAGCTALRVELVGTRTSGSDDRTTISHDCGCDGATDSSHSWTYSGSNNIWQPSHLGEVRILNGSTLLAAETFTVN